MLVRLSLMYRDRRVDCPRCEAGGASFLHKAWSSLVFMHIAGGGRTKTMKLWLEKPPKRYLVGLVSRTKRGKMTWKFVQLALVLALGWLKIHHPSLVLWMKDIAEWVVAEEFHMKLL
ncbi:hypothetical protein NDU88_004405 [Pleurodeles waltl]|uniref:Uncharacterized protein n=1 Tax=Pleurodeles waltl TaxID=8319 RepID=A0AAV7L6M0_PLEWA|nr:hypothetical protein NDU88_004405 [Pleurodeles waltl]